LKKFAIDAIAVTSGTSAFKSRQFSITSDGEVSYSSVLLAEIALNGH